MEPQQIIDLFIKLGAGGLISVLLWKRLIKLTDLFIEKLELIEKQHRDEMKDLTEKYRSEMKDLIEKYRVLTEKTVEAMTKVEVLFREKTRRSSHNST